VYKNSEHNFSYVFVYYCKYPGIGQNVLQTALELIVDAIYASMVKQNIHTPQLTLRWCARKEDDAKQFMTGLIFIFILFPAHPPMHSWYLFTNQKQNS